MNELKPLPSVLIKLGSLYVHIEEAFSKKAHNFDVLAMKALMDDGELKEWIKGMDKLALIPKKR